MCLAYDAYESQVAIRVLNEYQIYDVDTMGRQVGTTHVASVRFEDLHPNNAAAPADVYYEAPARRSVDTPDEHCGFRTGSHINLHLLLWLHSKRATMGGRPPPTRDTCNGSAPPIYVLTSNIIFMQGRMLDLCCLKPTGRLGGYYSIVQKENGSHQQWVRPEGRTWILTERSAQACFPFYGYF